MALEPHHGHLNKVACMASRFTEELFPVNSLDVACAGRWGNLAGWWHDLGKFAPAWQAYLRRKATGAEGAGTVDHSTAGAQHAVRVDKLLGHLLAYAIAGHHAGLPDAEGAEACLRERLRRELPFCEEDAPAELLQMSFPPLPPFLASMLGTSRDAFSVSFFVRMLFSCLVDADFLATESFMSAQQHAHRNSAPVDSLERMEKLVAEKISAFPAPSVGDTVNRKRAEVVADCDRASSGPSGLYTLTVPTGGGKTLSSLLFALRHALANGQRRVIFVVPFTSIIEQNAAVMREIFRPLEREGFMPLIEHHSSLAPDRDTPAARLAAENWDAPLVVTTAVQFYESLFAARTSKARKIHNIANAVVVLDEAQTLPVNYLKPCLRVLQELADHYNTTSVLCTATQPAVGYDADLFSIGLRGCHEIIADPSGLFAALKRVEVHTLGELDDAALASDMLTHRQVLCVLNRRRHAQELFQLLGPDEAHFHLSALMCPEHRTQVLARVRDRLREGLPVRLVSTQLIEAGVDVDFPVVYRALAGLDSIAQAAGRCNRNGRLGAPGQVYVFKPQDQTAERYFQETAQVTSQLLELHEDLLGEAAIRHYFDLYYYGQKHRWDAKGILSHDNFRLRGDRPELPFYFNFRTAAEDFRLIDDGQESVIIPFDETAEALVAKLRNEHIPLSRDLLRALQRYTVQIRPRELEASRGCFDHPREGDFHTLISPELHYNDATGLCLDEAAAGPQAIIC
ncbi:MAG: CRISPR-associated endonuclease Cas3'' [Puniceicoccales bacterium]